LLLREELKESDIPGRTALCNHIEKAFKTYMQKLEEDLKVCNIQGICGPTYCFVQRAAGKISFTTDVWTDPNMTSFMAVTAHWLEVIEEQSGSGNHKKLRLRADLIGFHKIPGRHTGKHLAYCFLFITDRLNITEKVSIIESSKYSIVHKAVWMDYM
jgi:hypothetical protein